MRIMAYDPSLVYLGYAYGHILNGALVIEAAGTFRPDKFLKTTGMFDVGDVTTDRQLAVEHFITTALSGFKPVAISGETSFYNGCNPSTIINQSKGLGLIEKLCRTYLTDIRSPFELALYQPNVIKSTLGLDKSKDEFKDKLAINRHIYRHIKEGSISYLNDEYLPDKQLDHANDAVAMLYTIMTRILRLELTDIK